MLIDEIEIAAKHWHEISRTGDAVPGIDAPAASLLDSVWWPRIRAALLYAKEMDRRLCDMGVTKAVDQLQFREAMGE